METKQHEGYLGRERKVIPPDYQGVQKCDTFSFTRQILKRRNYIQADCRESLGNFLKSTWRNPPLYTRGGRDEQFLVGSQ